MRILMLGTGAFAVPTLAALLDAGHDIPALITRPTPPTKGREKAAPNPMRDLAESRGLAVLAPESINAPEACQQLAALRPELLVVCDYGQILSPQALATAPLGGINLHGSLLPKYRGAAPVHWAILNGDAKTGVTVIHMTPRLDAGPILSIRTTPIGPEETTPELEDRLARLGVEAVRDAICLLARWNRRSPLGTRQDPGAATKAPRLNKQDGAVDWSRDSARIRNQIRALQPWPGTYTYWRRSTGEPLRLILFSARILGGESKGEPGEVLASDSGELVIATRDGALAIDRLQPAGKRIMDASEFLRGYGVHPGDRFGPA